MDKTKNDLESHNKKKKSSDKAKRKARERNRDRMRKKREEIRNNVDKYEDEKRKERERYNRRVQAGKIKKINELNARAQRSVRKVWRDKTRKSRQNKKREQIEKQFAEVTSPDSPLCNNVELSYETPCCSQQTHMKMGFRLNHQKDSGKKRSRKHREEMKKKISELEIKVKKLETRCNKYKVRYSRLQKEELQGKDTPKKYVKRLVKGQLVSKTIKRKLLFGEVLKAQLRDNFTESKTLREKRNMINFISGKIVKKYRCQSLSLKSLTLKRITRNGKDLQREMITKNRILGVMQKIREFLEKDENSRLCAGKKECITRRKEKKKKRLLTDTLLNLFRKFKLSHPHIKLSYASFCKLRPFWIVSPSLKRETCLCTHHENMILVVTKLKQLKMIAENTPDEVTKSICCNDQKDICLQRICLECKDKEIVFTLEESEKNDDTSYEKWTTKKVKNVIKGQERLCQKTQKECIKCTKNELLSILQSTIHKYMNHVNNMRHQYKKIQQIKKELTTKEVLVHLDFSENYQTKYHREVQSAHFGGSKELLTLHTVVVYYRPSEDQNIEAVSYCTVSSNIRHDPVAICVHLDPVLSAIKEKVHDIKTIYFLSDSPTTQYRNRKMFYLMGAYLSRQLDVDYLQWHYTESGHGKGAPDGVGGCIKRSADSLVSRSKDINTCESFIAQLKESCSKITILGIDEKKMNYLDSIMPKDLPTLAGTMKVHQVTWRKSDKQLLEARRLSCLCCKPDASCKHFHIGTIFLNNNEYTPAISKLQHKEVCESASERDEENPYKIEDLINQLPSVSVNSFVVVKFSTNKNVKHYIGVILSIEQGEIEIKFLRKSGQKFVFPPNDDICMVEREDIISIMQQPNLNNRGQYVFPDDLSYIPNLC